MKKILLPAVLILLLSSCNKLDELTQFTVSFENQGTIPATTVVNVPIDITTPPIETNYESTYENNNTSADLIESVKLHACTLSILSPEGSNFDFLKSIKVYLIAEGLDDVLIANIPDVPDGLTELEVEVDDHDLKPYLEAKEIKLHLQAETDKVISQDHEVNAVVELLVDAKILGV